MPILLAFANRQQERKHRLATGFQSLQTFCADLAILTRDATNANELHAVYKIARQADELLQTQTVAVALKLNEMNR